MHTPHPAWLQEILVPVSPKLVLKNLARVKVEGISPFLTEIHILGVILRDVVYKLENLLVIS